VVLAAAILLYTGTGRLITARVPGNAIGWLLALIGLLLAGVMLTEHYALYGLVTAPGALPLVKLTGWFSVILAVLAVFAVPFLLLLFPDGRLPSSRWRPVRLAIGVVLAATMLTQMQAGQLISGGLTDVLDNAHASYSNPVGIFPRHGWFGGFIALVIVLAAAAGLTCVASVFARRREASTERRKQLAWLGYVGVLTLFWFSGLLLSQLIGGGGPA
jgi:two-component system, NarL family, sensor kinase